jgi:hypothetical protein
MRVSPGRTGGFESCAAQSGRLESLTRPQSFGHLIDRLRKNVTMRDHQRPTLAQYALVTETVAC